MVSRFRRTLSFPKSTITTRPSLQEKSYHVRSVSLPCRSHPLLSQLTDEINDLKSWLSKTDDRTCSWVCDGLIMLKNLHEAVDDLLQLPKTQELLTKKSKWVDNLLEEFLRFVDVYGIFRAALVGLKEEQVAAQVAIRRRDVAKIGAYVKAKKKMDKEMKKLVSTVRCMGRNSSSGLEFDGDAELAGIFHEVKEVTVAVTVAMLNGISGSSMRCNAWVGWNLMKKEKESKSEEGIREFEEVEMESLKKLKRQGDEDVRRILKKLRGLESSIGMIEIESQKVFRSLISTRVSLLNIINP